VAEIIALLHKVATQQHVAVFLSAHEMNPLLPVMDRVVYVANGRVASGTTEEVVRPDVLQRALRPPRPTYFACTAACLVVAGHDSDESPTVADHPELVVE